MKKQKAQEATQSRSLREQLDDIAAAIPFTPESVANASVEQAKLTCAAAFAHMETYKAARYAKAAREEVESLVAQEIRDAARTSGDKCTEASIGEKVAIDSRVQVARRAEIDSDSLDKLAGDLLAALRDRRAGLEIVSPHVFAEQAAQRAASIADSGKDSIRGALKSRYPGR